jgi:septal ring factor EnvC (AmiA/AmiB activator)
VLAAALCLWSAAQPGPASAQSEEETRDRLEQVQSRIRELDRVLQRDRARQGKLQTQLREAEVTLGEVARGIVDTRRRQTAAREQLAGLQARRQTLEAARAAQEQRVASELKRAYQMGRQGPVKVLLNQEQPDTTARAMTYYRYLYQARSAQIADYRATISEIRTVEAGIDEANRELEQVRATLEKQQSNLEQAQHSRREAIASLDRSIRTRDDELQQLQSDREELEKLLALIEEAVVDLAVPENFKPFREVKGTMPWPLPGKHSNGFGRPRNEGKMRWRGVTIPAAEGSVVRAIHHGRVVYADWFRGSGLLLIVDHGDGYMSLYAHNQSLLREVGEWVSAGAPISTAGNSGGQQASALYFEIRHQGKPVDPSDWCRG